MSADSFKGSTLEPCSALTSPPPSGHAQPHLFPRLESCLLTPVLPLCIISSRPESCAKMPSRFPPPCFPVFCCRFLLSSGDCNTQFLPLGGFCCVSEITLSGGGGGFPFKSTHSHQLLPTAPRITNMKSRSGNEERQRISFLH